jgi:hypothetical protein
MGYSNDVSAIPYWDGFALEVGWLVTVAGSMAGAHPGGYA